MWKVEFCDEFESEFESFTDQEQDAIAQRLLLLKMKGPHLARPYADTLYGSSFKNMKELRFEADGAVWRVAYAFDPERKAIVLVAGNKAGQNQRRFYEKLIDAADTRFARFLKGHGKS